MLRVAISDMHLIGIFIKQLKMSSWEKAANKKPKKKRDTKDSLALVDLVA